MRTEIAVGIRGRARRPGPARLRPRADAPPRPAGRVRGDLDPVRDRLPGAWTAAIGLIAAAGGIASSPVRSSRSARSAAGASARSRVLRQWWSGRPQSRSSRPRPHPCRSWPSPACWCSSSSATAPRRCSKSRTRSVRQSHRPRSPSLVASRRRSSSRPRGATRRDARSRRAGRGHRPARDARLRPARRADRRRRARGAHRSARCSSSPRAGSPIRRRPRVRR